MKLAVVVSLSLLGCAGAAPAPPVVELPPAAPPSSTPQPVSAAPTPPPEAVASPEVAAPAPKRARAAWKIGDVVDVEITLVVTDRKDLACASTAVVSGMHCAFQAEGQPWSNGGPEDDAIILRPYTSTDRRQFVGAGLWSQPALARRRLPATRFSARCKYSVEGALGDLSARWEETGQWFPQKEWYAGTLSRCTVEP